MEKYKNIPSLRFPEFNNVWEQHSLKEIAEKIQDGTHFSPKSKNEGEYLYITSKNVKNGYVDLTNIQYVDKNSHLNIYKRCDVAFGDVLVTKDGTIGQVCVNELQEPFSMLSSVAFIRTNHKSNNYFIYNLLSSPIGQREINKAIAGQALKRITLTKLNNFKYKIPSLTEQLRIASFLTLINEKIIKLKDKKSHIEKYKKGVMQKIFSMEIRFKDENGKEFPKWEKKKLSEIANYRRGSFPQPYGLDKWYDEDNGTPFVQVFDVDDNFKLKNDTKNKISDLAKPLSVFVKKGTLVLTLQGSIGRIAITQYDSYVDRTLLIFKSYKIPINIYFLIYVVFLLFQIEKEKAPGGIIKTITKEVLSDFVIFVPNIKEQELIANFLSAIDEKINLVSEQIGKTELWKKGLLQKMFC